MFSGFGRFSHLNRTNSINRSLISGLRLHENTGTIRKAIRAVLTGLVLKAGELERAPQRKLGRRYQIIT